MKIFTKKHFVKCVILLMFIVSLSYGQEVNDKKVGFIRVYSSQFTLRPPFLMKEVEISKSKICYRNLLPPRQSINENYINEYDSLDTEPQNKTMRAIDYDSIVNFILYSGLLQIDLKYTQPDTTGGIMLMNMGGGSFQYVIETTSGKLNLQISGARDFKLPDILVDFNKLFERIADRYSFKK